MAPASSPREVYDSLQALLNPATQYPGGRYRPTGEIREGLKHIRRIILTDGIPEVEGRPSLRPRVWKLMLKVDHLGAEDYLRYVAMGPSCVSAKIKDDTFRTFRTDMGFQGRVTETMQIRLLEAIAWKRGGTYVQGMNGLAAPFLYAMPSQLEAFACFSALLERACPRYVLQGVNGATAGAQLVDRCLRIIDPELFEHLASKGLTGEIYAFASILTMSACTPPLLEVLKLWDFLITFGVHLNVLCIIAQLLLVRDKLIMSSSPTSILRTFPPLQARPVIDITVLIIRDIPEDLYRELVAHPVHHVDLSASAER